MKGYLEIPLNVETIENLAFGGTNFESIKSLANDIKCSSTVFTNNPTVSVTSDFKEEKFCGLTIQKPKEPKKSKFDKDIIKIIALCVGALIIGLVGGGICCKCCKRCKHYNRKGNDSSYSECSYSIENINMKTRIL